MSEDKPTIFVLFGATGDLAKRMVLPAFFELASRGLLPESWTLIGSGRGDLSSDDFREHAKDAVTEFGSEPDAAEWKHFAERLLFAGGGFDASDPGRLVDVLGEAQQSFGDDDGDSDVQYIFYLAVPPSAFARITEGIGAHSLARGARVVFEKPFGTSPQNFRELDRAVHDVLDEDQIYRIDHFLGKEGTQNLHALRFGNGLFEGAWNRENVAAVHIDVPETLDISDRVEFYDQTGALLDMIVTHLFQLAAEIAMEPPISMEPEDLRSAREAVIAAFRPLDPSEVVLGQFDGYSETDGVAEQSTTDTFVAAKLWIDTDRWRDVPFLLRTGKQLAEGKERVSLVFRGPQTGPLTTVVPSNGTVLTIDLAGSGGIHLDLVVKAPGPSFELAPLTAAVSLESVDDTDPLSPYAKLLRDVVVGDRSLFTRPDGLQHTWEVIEPVLNDRPRVFPYARGSWGPAEARPIADPTGWLLGP
jgi:glucose-6-phosphate 1-dehydrogenase